MRDVLPELREWLAVGEPFTLVTVVRTWRSAPRPAGAVMAVNAAGEVLGSLSGGCVEGTVYDLAQEVLADGVPRAAHYGVTGSDAAAVGLACGGEIDVLARRVDPADESGQVLDRVLTAIAADEAAVLATLVTPEAPQAGGTIGVGRDWELGSLGQPRLDSSVVADARARLDIGDTGSTTYGPEGERGADDLEVFLSVHAPRPRLIVAGAIDFAAAVCGLGAFLGYDVTLVDARGVFATPRRFPDADRVVVSWPHRYLQAEVDAGRITPSTAIVVLTHDHKFDVPMLQVALRCPARYVGAMGSRRTHDERLERLREVGLTPAELARLRSPIGLDLGGRTPTETAVSIMAEVIADRRGGAALPLSGGAGRIHRD
ncbi:MAG: XdhC family protein [Austwickia sp.]|nr:XdhC family protein [Austwickia sp.]MBK9100250.1 XdhC family protein [Austwickia sp.]